VTKTTSSLSPAAIDYDATLILAVETSNKNWVLAAHVPGLGPVKAKQTIDPSAEALAKAIEGYRRRATGCGATVDRVIVVYEAGYGGFWLARWLDTRGQLGAWIGVTRKGAFVQVIAFNPRR
jgi:transposase